MKHISVVCMFALMAVFGGAAFATTPAAVVATTNYVDDRVELDTTNNKITVQNSGTVKAELATNSQTTTVSPSSTEIATVGWTDTNRTSKVRSGGENSTTLVNMWIGD